MTKQSIAYKDTGYFSKLMCDYLDEASSLQEFYGNFPKLANFQKQIALKKESFSAESRAVLVDSLQKQYKNITLSEATQKNITSLSEENTFTITTGHQLNLFTGPLYFLYKIFSVINLSEQLKKAYPDSNFVPVYWMATEDHDFEEINYFNLFGKKVQWKRKDGGAVGELSTEGLADVAAILLKQFGDSENGKALSSLFSEAYLKHDNLAEATRDLGNALFAKYGLVIVDGNDTDLKKAFVPYAHKEIESQLSFNKITKTTQKLTALGYPEQVHPREINLFYLDKGIRERIIEKDGRFYINETTLEFSKDELLELIEAAPEKFSPNALLRPLYQEVILPNLCYIGGGGEVAYWLQLKDYFESVSVPFPVLLLRNSVLLMPTYLSEKLKKMEVPLESLFLKQSDLRTKHTHQISEVAIDFSTQRTHLEQQFKDLYNLAEKTDASFKGAVGAQEKKQLNGLDHLEKRLLKAQKRKLKDELERLTELQNELFPNQGLQERTLNFSEFYLEYGDILLSELKENLDPLHHEFTILEL
ncbi:bacillithiol biosynthesis cysteine-adding enzyme BshC [Ulvibacter antarcticus]|uniref:Putative cysteine ligase BshC n=1 Tax=Ulvibacter antarcticus TaxID=442714 RepID=A0A3L9YDI1_9FLAO|nr:bacillithiol biosynthesis cysteine-adding enzyme BshC [Ulvibacter antarcticus]RMA58514.1 bacillithiol biosynthesis cysteine-adding enzyme BshC [Ulvibacter antarcticus]